MQKVVRFAALVLGLLFALGGVTHVHAAGYTANITTAYPQLAINANASQVVWSSCNSGGTWPSAYNLCDDGVSQVMPIGFSFTFAGTTYNNWSMSTNGVLFFETASSGNSTGNNTYTPSNLPSTALGSPAKPALMPFWADLQKNASVAGANNMGQPANASFYQYETQTQPSGAKVLVVQLKNVVYWNTSPQLYVNLQVQIWSTGEIVYSYGAMQAMTTNPLLRVGLQSAGGTVCHTLANNQTTSLSNQSFVYTWDVSAAACSSMPTVNHYEIRQDGAATLCAEPITVLACSSATTPCPAANIMNSLIITAQVTVSGTGVTNVTESPPSFNIQPSAPLQTVNLTWASGSSGTATLGVSAAVTPTSATVKCTNAAGTATSACTMTVANTACIAPPHHYQITGPANGSTCANSTFTIKAWADAAETTAYTAGTATGTLTQTGNPASLPSLGAFSIPAGSSTVSITPISFPATGTTTFNTTATPALVGTTTCNFGGFTSCGFVTSSATCVADFNCVETTSNAAIAADSNSSTGRLYTKLAGTAFSFDVVARKSDGSTATSYLSDSGKSVTVSLVDGSSGAGATCTPTALSPAGPASQTLTFAAGDSGRKNITFTAPKAYQNVRCYAIDTNATVTKGCSQDNFAIRPPGITLATSASAAPPPSATAATNTPTVMAGASFTLQATTSSGTNYIGTLALDATKLTAQTTTQVATAQSGGVVGTLTPTTLATNPATLPTNNATYSEVGYLYLAPGAYYDNASAAFTAVDNNANGDCIANSFSDALTGGKYGCNIGNAAVSLGRFQPGYFTTVVTPGCSGFTYAGSTTPARVGQPFSVVTTAKAIGGATTTNYTGAFAKTVTHSDASVTTGFSNNTLTTFTSGVGTANNVLYATATPQTGPVTLTVRATDNDTTAVSSTPTTATPAGLSPTPEGTSPMRSGRARLKTAYGSELLDLPMPFATEFWNGSGWATNANDTCTTDTGVSLLTRTFVAAPAGSALTAANVAANVCAWDTGTPGLSGIGCAAAGAAAKKFSKPPAAGNFNLNLKAPGAGMAGSVDITAMVPVWLQFDWLGAGVANPKGRATFGVYKSPLLYRRENY